MYNLRNDTLHAYFKSEDAVYSTYDLALSSDSQRSNLDINGIEITIDLEFES